MKRNPVFADNDYKQQADSTKSTINSLPKAVAFHVREGRRLGKRGVDEYPGKVARQLELIADRIRNIH